MPDINTMSVVFGRYLYPFLIEMHLTNDCQICTTELESRSSGDELCARSGFITTYY